MIISRRHRFIFIKTAKTAGTSIEVLLARHASEDDVVTPIEPPFPGHQARNHAGFYNHMPACEARAAIGEPAWRGHFSFCVERNPWDKVLSHWHMERHRSGGVLSLDDYLARGHFPRNIDKYTEPGDARRMIVDRILRYENLDSDLAEVLPSIGIPFSGTLEPRAKAEYRVDRRPYREVLSAAQAEFIARAFADEIALHGYVY